MIKKRDSAVVKIFMVRPPKTAQFQNAFSSVNSPRQRWPICFMQLQHYGRFTEESNKSECFGHSATFSRDQRVNHPDFYDVRQYRLGQIEVAISIKEKSAPQKTYLFLRVQGGNPD